MLNSLSSIIGSHNQRVVRKLRKRVDRINALEPEMQKLSDAELQARTAQFRQQLQAGASLDDIMEAAYATVREAGVRALGMRHFDVQIIGGMILNERRIAEMRTGEGKTLVATLPVYLNALSGEGVHVITVNDYLARRDADWMGKLYNFLGMSVGVILSGQAPEEKKAAYAADITYGTNNEYGFDYLRDNMAFGPQERAMRGLNYALVDEVDSILIDEARTPLIISGPTDDDPAVYQRINKLVPRLEKGSGGQNDEPEVGDFVIDEKQKTVSLTEQGHENTEQLMLQAGLIDAGGSLYDPGNIVLMHHLSAALRAHNIYRRDVDYIVQGTEVVIVDEFTGRTMPGRRWSEGLHQAVEAKEGVPIQRENQTLASITFQNYFRLYEKLAGMTGTADTEAYEFQEIYGLDVSVIPTNKPAARDDKADLVFMTAQEKFEAVAADIDASRAKGQPVLVGTASIETSEILSSLLKKRGVEHRVLNAKQHEREALIIAEAGRPGIVTIATNMAGRGTDIVLGGNPEGVIAELPEDTPQEELDRIRAGWQARHDQVIAAGGLKVIGSERNESRRIDNQLRGRSGRQGDPGETRFYLSLEDTLMRIFTPPRLQAMLQKLGMAPGEAIEHRWVSRAIENAQRKVEAHNFDIRKNLLEYDNVSNDQRKVIYEQRNELLDNDEIAQIIENIWNDVVDILVLTYIPPNSLEEQWDVKGLTEAIKTDFGAELPIDQWLEADSQLDSQALSERLRAELWALYKTKRESIGDEVMARIEKSVMLQVLDTLWREHLAAMDYLRKGIHLRGYAQKDPKQEYKREGFEMFSEMLDRLKHEVITLLARGQLQSADDTDEMQAAARRRQQQMSFQHAEAASALSGQGPGDPEQAADAQGGNSAAPPPRVETFVREGEKVGRNDPCPCGSGKKYKQCHGKLV